MSAAASFPWSEDRAQDAELGFRPIFEHAPIPAARCNAQGMILEVNPAFERFLERKKAPALPLRLSDLLTPCAPETAESVLHDLLNGNRDQLRIKAITLNGKEKGEDEDEPMDWIAWRTAERGGNPPEVLLTAERNFENPVLPGPSAQAHRWESVGRLTGGVAHDFNNLMTGVMLYCDLLLSGLDAGDKRLRRYAEAIRAAVGQTSGLVRQLLTFAKPQSSEPHALSMNDTAETMRDLLVRLIGENIALDLRLDQTLAAVEMEQTQLEQILINLILNARDALPKGGRILVETSNCTFQTLSASASTPAGFPCVLLAVTDNGRGMDPQTRARLFEPFFTTKDSGSGIGLGLTTVRTIVTNNRGLIHIDTEAGRGTRVMILLPQCSKIASSPHLAHFDLNSQETTPRENKKETRL
jgi:two-component system, cell cycle sensor histidine kinase and response regulator CckA